MEEFVESKLTRDDSMDLEEVVTPVTKEAVELDHEKSIFQRGIKTTMSVGRSFLKNKQPVGRQQSKESVASNISKSRKNNGMFGSLFSLTGKKDYYKDEVTLLKKENAYLKTQLINDVEELNHLRKENSSMEKTIRSLKNAVTELERENENLKKENKEIQAREAKIKSTVIEMNKFYEKKIAHFDSENYVEITKAESVQIGSGNIQHISNLDLDGLDRLLTQYHEKLETVAQELIQTDNSFQMTKHTIELLHQKVTALEDIVKEMTESLNEIKLSKQEITTELECTISLTDPDSKMY